MRALIRQVEETVPIRIPDATSLQAVSRARVEMMRDFQLFKHTSDRAIVRKIPGLGGSLPLRVFPREKPRGLLLHIHGGGWWAGTSDMQDELLERYSEEINVAVVTVDYRLAPEHPYPAGPDDCETAALWLAEHAKREFGTDRLLIAGESSGAHLAAVTLIRMRDRRGFRHFLGASLAFGIFDLTGLPSHASLDDRSLILNSQFIRWIKDLFVPDSLRSDPDVSPLRADLAGLPPALFTVGTLDPLLDDSLFMHARWIAAGNQAELAIYPGGVHGFMGMGRTPESQRALGRIESFLGSCLE